ncbi:MAG: hypothetical protein ACRD3B_10075 [Candidatus Sulfotelmatobacter sp.]
MKKNDVAFFMRYHSDKATELREGIVGVLEEVKMAVTREELLAKLPQGAHDYVMSEQPRVFDVVLGNLERDGFVLATRKGKGVTYRRQQAGSTPLN